MTEAQPEKSRPENPSAETLQYIETPLPAEFSAEEINILKKVNQKIAGVPNLRQTIHYLFEVTKEICRCDRVAVAFVADDEQRLTCQCVKASYEPIYLKEGYSEDLSGSSLQRVIRAGRCRLIGDLEDYARQHPASASTKLLLKEGVRSSMTCPLRVDDRVVGLLFRSSRTPHTFTPHMVRIHLAISERLSQAVEKAWRIEQLAQANNAYMELLSFVTHELKSPVASMVMTLELLLEERFGPLNDDQRDKLKRMEFKGQYLLLLIRDYLNLARLEGGTLSCTPRGDVDLLGEVIEPACEMVTVWLEGKGMGLHRKLSGELADIECDPDLLTIALTNLLNNAAKYGRKGGTIRLTGNRQDDGLSVSVWNEGQGFKPEDRPKLFRKFSRLSDPTLRKAKGTGVGLYMVWRIIKAHGGRINADSEYGQWAEFRFFLPQPIPQNHNAAD
jgi:signal transduction histidine kinase